MCWKVRARDALPGDVVEDLGQHLLERLRGRRQVREELVLRRVGPVDDVRHDLDREEGRPRQFGGVGEGRGLHVLADRAALFNNRRVRRRAVQRVARRAEARLEGERLD